MKWPFIFLLGMIFGVGVGLWWGIADRAELKRALAKSVQQCDDWRDLAVLRDEELQAAYKELEK